MNHANTQASSSGQQNFSNNGTGGNSSVGNASLTANDLTNLTNLQVAWNQHQQHQATTQHQQNLTSLQAVVQSGSGMTSHT